VKRDWCYFRFLSGRKLITRHDFCNSFGTATRRWTRKTSSYSGGIGRGTRNRREFYFRSRYFRFRPWCNPWSLRVYIGAIDRHVIESAGPYQSVWTVKPLPVGLFPLPVDPRWRPGPTWKSGSSWELGNPWDPLRSADFTVILRKG